MPHVERARQGASWGLLGTAQLLTHSRGGPTKLSHAGPGWAGRLAQASLTQIHSGRGHREGQGGPGSTHGQEGSQDSGRGTKPPTCPLFLSLSEDD